MSAFQNRDGGQRRLPVLSMLLLASITPLLLSCAGVWASSPGVAADREQVQVVAHRGCWHEAPENSLAAITACREAGIAIVEIDVQQSADGALVVMHDETVDRTTNGTGRIAELDWSEIAALRLREAVGGPGAPVTDHAPPLLAAALAAAGDTMLLNLDVKDARIFAAVVALLRETGAGANVIVKSALPPDSSAFTVFKSLGPVRFMPVVRQCDEAVRLPAELFCIGDGADVSAAYAGLEPFGYELIFHDEAFLIDFVRSRGGAPTRIWVNVLASGHAAGHIDALALTNPEMHWGRLIDLGATILQTDYPEQMVAYFGARRVPPADQP